MKTIFLFLTSVILVSCVSDDVIAPPQDLTDNLIGIIETEPLEVLILGNSIVRHEAAPSIGWDGDWGMAASAPNKDFVSQVYHNVTAKNIAVWEYTFNLPEVPTQEYDFIVVRLGENVRDLDGFAQSLPDLVNLYKSSNTKVIVTGMSWWNEGTDGVLEEFALSNGYIYVSLQGMWGTEYQATEYEYDAVAVHANDLGHKFIADKINEKF